MHWSMLAVLWGLSFGIAIESAADESSVRFAVIGDYGTDDSHEAHVAEMVQSWARQPGGLDFIITVGDNNYDSTLSNATYTARVCKGQSGVYYGPFVKSPGDPEGTSCTASDNRLFPSPGNHDWNAEVGYDAYESFFPWAGRWDPKQNEFLHYSFARPASSPLVQLYALNVNCAAADSGGRGGNSGNHGCPVRGSKDCLHQYAAQKSWMKDVMAQSPAPWQIVYFHQPPYSFGGNEGDCPPIIGAFDFAGSGYQNASDQPLSMVISGHSHVYERIQLKRRPNRPFLVVGSSGELDSSSSSCDHPHPPPTVQEAICHGSHHGALLVTATSSRLSFDFYYQGQSTPEDSCTLAYAQGASTPTLSCP